MGIFRYKCDNCNVEDDYLLKKDESPTCTRCGHDELTKVYMGQTFGFTIRGSKNFPQPSDIPEDLKPIVADLPPGIYQERTYAGDELIRSGVIVKGTDSLESKVEKSKLN